MITKYCVVRYVPNPLSGETVNVGVVAWGEGKIATEFVKNWKRVKAFGREDISFLREFVEQAEASSILGRNLPSLGPTPISEQQLQEITESWSNSIQFSDTPDFSNVT